MIQTTKQEKLGPLLALVLKLQDETSFTNQQEKQEVLNQLVIYAQQNYPNLDPSQPDKFLHDLLGELLTENAKPTELPPGNIIPQELVEIYKHKKEAEENLIQKTIGSEKDHKDFRSYIENIKQLVSKNQPQLPEELVTEIAEESAKKTIASLEPISQPNVLTKEDRNKIIEQAEAVIEDELKKVETEAKNVVQEAERIVGKEAQRIQQEKTSVSQEGARTKTAFQQTQRALERETPTAPVTKTIVTPEEAVVQEAERIVRKENQRIQKEKSPIITEEFRKAIEMQSIKIATNPKIIQPIKEAVKTVIPLHQEFSLPDDIRKRLEESSQEVSSLPEKILRPSVAGAWIQEKVYAVPAKLLQIGAKEKGATPEWQAITENGASYKTYERGIKVLKDWGLPANHPVIKKLEDKAARFKEQQQIFYKVRKGKSFIQVGHDSSATRILARYHKYGLITGKTKIYDSDLKANLPLDLPLGRWGGFLRRFSQRFRFVNKGYEKISQFVTRGKYTSLLAPAKNFLSKRFAQPVVKWLAKTAVGKAAKQGVKKAAGWLAVKLGVKMGIRAAAVAAAPESAGISLLIGVAIEVGTWLLSKIKTGIITLIKDPEKALIAVGSGILLLVFVPMPFGLIGTLPLVMGGLGLASFALAPATLGSLGGGFSGFFSILGGGFSTLPITLFVVILFGVIGSFTLFIVLVVSGAFILPTQISESDITKISPYVSDYFEISKSASVNKLDNYQVEDAEGETIKYTIKIKPKGNYGLAGATLEDNFTVFKENSTSLEVDNSDCQFTPKEVQEAIDKNQSLECSVHLDSRFKNSAISNTATLTTSVTGGDVVGFHQGMASAVVVVGNPPMLCPQGWPTSHGYITQGPDAGYSHGGDEAIDIGGVSNTTEVHATHQGTVYTVNYQGGRKTSSGWKSGAGHYIVIKGTCLGQTFYTNYFHLKAGSIKVKVGDPIVAFQPLATTDSSGMVNSSGIPIRADHLHYEFTPYGGIVKMIADYIPRTVKRGCDGNCNISW